MAKLTGSETARAPLGIVKFLLPLNVRVFKVAKFIALAPAVPFLGRAIVAVVICRSFTPKALEKRTRIWSPPIDVRTVCRMVESVKTDVDVV